MYTRHLRCFVMALCLSLGLVQLVLADNANDVEEIGLRAEELAALRGWNTVNHDVQISDGYIVNVLELVNPNMSATEANIKEPAIFFHGIQLEGNCWLINSAGASPKNYANRNASAMSPQQLDALIGNDPTSGSFAFTASNFAHRTFIVNRRGTIESRGHVDPTRQACLVDPNTSAAYAAASQYAQSSLPTLQKALNLTSAQQSNSTIGSESDFANGKLYRNYSYVADNPRYWNYSFDQQAARDVVEILKFVLNLTGKEKASLVGHSAGGALILMALTSLPEIANNILHAIVWAPALDLISNLVESPVSQLLAIHYFDFDDAALNQAAYGSIIPPLYDITRIISKKLAFYYGNMDKLVTPIDINTTIGRLSPAIRQASEIHFINGPNIFFNHMSFFWHKNVYKLLIRDSLRTLESS